MSGIFVKSYPPPTESLDPPIQGGGVNHVEPFLSRGVFLGVFGSQDSAGQFSDFFWGKIISAYFSHEFLYGYRDLNQPGFT